MEESSTHGGDERWGWDLRAERAVRWDSRGPGHQILGPYPTREAAEAWSQRRDDRAQQWDDDDEVWESTWGDTDSGPDAATPAAADPERRGDDADGGDSATLA